MYYGDGVAKRSKASIAMHTVAGSNLGHGWHLSSGKSQCLERETAIPHPGMKKPTGAQIEILPIRRPN
ncbi:Uncharacterized protein FWK35_00009366 [Aphis craccivora]|uniref:Uncharacterized protein n=1 Tax=Aphis craccivora TaxID=307492 RepID=A0A6G0YG54_APHCR|nr:Uncharacterized protein FWK35_00009366 [Aphis craccivora]